MRIAYISAGAGGMFCGSCLHDNTLAAALVALGHDALLIPTYTPLRTDEPDVSERSVFLGGINAYLQQKLSLFRHTPRFFDWFLDARPLLRWVARFAVRTQAEDLAELAISVLKGEHGYQRKEVARLVDWLADELKPDVVLFSNVLLSGIVHSLRARLKVPVLATLQGDDVFLEALPEPSRKAALELIAAHCREIDGFIATSRYYADFMSAYLHVPRERIDVVYPGLNLKGHGEPRPVRPANPCTIGYFARICPEKGLHNLVEAFCRLRQGEGTPQAKLRVSGWLGENNRAYFEGQKARLSQAGLLGDFAHVESPDLASKLAFMQSIDVLSVPTTYHEPKGLYVLEAWANGVPVVQPRHGSFPELIEATGGGLVVEPDDPADLARGLRELMDPVLRETLGQRGKRAVFERFHARAIGRGHAWRTWEVFMTAFRTTHRVEFHETDMAGIVHFSNFFRYMECAEVEFLRARGLSVAMPWEGENIGFPRVSAKCDYLQSARFEDVLDIAVTIERIGEKSVTYGFEFARADETIARGTVTSVCCRFEPGHRLDAVPIPASYRARLEAVQT